MLPGSQGLPPAASSPLRERTLPRAPPRHPLRLVQGPGWISQPLADEARGSGAEEGAGRRGEEGRVLLVFLGLCLFLMEHEF